MLPCTPPQNKKITLLDTDYHYIVNVLRLNTGDTFDAIFGNNTYKACITEIDKRNKQCIIFCGDNTEYKRAAGRRIILFQALPKGQKTDLIIRQATECEVDTVVIFEGKYSVPRIKRDRWQRIIKEARQQSASAGGTKIKIADSLSGALQIWNELKAGIDAAYILPLVFLSPGEAADMPLYSGASLKKLLDPCFALAGIFIGCEGGFAPDEVTLLIEAGFKAASLGRSILRCETAAISAVSIVRL